MTTSENNKSVIDMIPDEEMKDFNNELSATDDVNTEEETVVEETKVEAPKKTSTTKKKTVENKEEKSVNDDIVPSVKKNKTQEFLNSISVDLNNIELTEPSEMQKFENMDFALKNKSTYQVILAQSCYSAFMEPLKMSDVNAITNSTLDVYQSRMKLYQTIYSKINGTSIGKVSFKDWLKITSYFDLPTLLYGIYMQTFPGTTDFSITCRHCEKNIDVKINNDTLISAKDEEVFKQFSEVSKDVNSPETALAKSLVNKYERIMLPESKTIIDIQTPSLANHLDLLNAVDPKKVAEVEDILTTLLFIKNVYMVDIKESMQSHKAKYFEVKKRNDIVSILNNLSLADYKELNKVMATRINKYAIEYKIKDFPCTNCGKSIGDIPIDIETLLFQQILQL